jgi:hypothetical protein
MYLVSLHCRCQKPRSKPINRADKAYVKRLSLLTLLTMLWRCWDVAQRFAGLTVFLDHGGHIF